ncbi:MAG: homocysteine S-methyltransferase family protein [Chloroflexi bacterium]|nr:homocysteine S-methyltransferase family protein [Chloroflexota bacterium]
MTIPIIKSNFLESLRTGTTLADGGIGSLIFQLTGRLASPDFLYESLNIRNPALIKGIHLSSLAAGATVITTNTFSANETEFTAAGIGDQVAQINYAAVQIAREAIEDHVAEYSVDIDEFFVMGSIGPGGSGVDAYSSQINALVESGVDAILLETFTDIERLIEITLHISSKSDAPPVISHGALDPGVGNNQAWPIEPAKFAALVANAGAAIAGINCVAPWVASEFISAAKLSPNVVSGELLLSAMPNAGGFERIGHRFLARSNPEYMGTLARQLGDSGASLVGGCCEVHPEHVREMSAYLKSRTSSIGTNFTVAKTSGVVRKRLTDDPRKMNGRFSQKIADGQFAISVEMVAPTGADPKALDLRARMVQEIVDEDIADAVDITDGSRGLPLVPPGDLVEIIRNRLEWRDNDQLEFIAHFTGRDINTLAVQSRLMGYHLRGIHNVLFITGDPPKMSPTYPRSSAVFDMNSVQMIRATANQLNVGRDFGGNPLGGGPEQRTKFMIGTGIEPEAINITAEIDRLKAKIDAGADYVMTQPVFDDSAMKSIESYRYLIPVLPGVMVIRSTAHAERIAQVPGVNLPQRVIDNFRKYADAGDQVKAGFDFAVRQAQTYRSEGWAGVYLMSPASVSAAKQVLKTLAE